MMEWGEFKKNVTQWADERGIYEHSTPEAQLMKALSELGELADAIIKNDIDGIRDGVGDYLVCIVNYANMVGIDLPDQEHYDDGLTDHDLIGSAAYELSNSLTGNLDGREDDSLMNGVYFVKAVAHNHGLKPEECMAAAWNEIRHRKGRVVKGGAFIKEE